VNRQRRVRPGLRAYLPLGLVVSGVTAIWIVIWIERGSGTGAWQPVVLFLGLYVLWCLVVSSRVLVLSDRDLACSYLTRPPAIVAWHDVHYSAITYWPGGVPIQILVYGEDRATPAIRIPVGIYSRRDVEYLMSLDRLRIRT